MVHRWIRRVRNRALRLEPADLVRTFLLQPRQGGSTDFAMDERFAGLLLPFVKRPLPDFGPVFTSYASDLKREAERAA